MKQAENSVLVPNTLTLITKTDISTGGVLFYFKLSCIFHIFISLKKRLVWCTLYGSAARPQSCKTIMHQYFSFKTIILKTVMYILGLGLKTDPGVSVWVSVTYHVGPLFINMFFSLSGTPEIAQIWIVRLWF